MDNKELLTRFQSSLEHQDQSSSTIRAYLSDIEVFRQWLLWLHEGEEVSLAEVQKPELIAFRKYLIHEKNQKPATVNRRVQTLRSFFQFLVKEGEIKSNPAESLRYVRRSSRKRPKSLKRKEVLNILRAANQSAHGMAPRNVAIVQLMLQTGLRVGEVAALKSEDILIRDRSGRVTVREGKGGKAREIPLNSAARRALSQYLENLNGHTKDSNSHLFKSKRGTGLSVRGLQNMILTLVREAGLDGKGISAHTLRHTFATNYLNSNPGKLTALASLMGHESLDTTAVYTQPSEEDLAEDLERSELNTFEL